MSKVWLTQSFTSVNCLTQQIKQRQFDQYLQTWSNSSNFSSKGKSYQLFKEHLIFENYINIIPENLWTVLLKFRTSNHYLPVETGRWNNTLLEDRRCALCNNNHIGDEFHYLFICNFVRDSRVQFLHPYYYYTRPSTYKFKELMNSKRISVLKKLSKFINVITNIFKRP